jgi:D-aspartate ligase
MPNGWRSGSLKLVPGQTGAIVIGANYGGLGIVRSLGRQGIPVIVLQDEHASAAASKFTRFRLPWPELGEESQIAFLLEICHTHNLMGWTIFPTTDESAALLSKHADSLRRHYVLTTPSWPVMQWAYDKRLTYELATELGIDHPSSFQPRNEDEAAALTCSFPVLLKPAIKHRVNQFTSDRAWPARDRDELIARYREASHLIEQDMILVQELIPGGGEAQYSFAALCDRGQPLAFGVAQRRRQYPVDFGHGSTYVETVDEPEIEEPSRRLLAHLEYTGLVELEYKRDPKTGYFKLLDINPRAWAWHSLGHRAGVDFPYLCWKMVHDEPFETIRARPGVRWVRMATDVPSAFNELRRRRLSLRAYVASLRRPLEFAVFSFDDPVPALIEAPSLFGRIWNRAFKLRQQTDVS